MKTKEVHKRSYNSFYLSSLHSWSDWLSPYQLVCMSENSKLILPWTVRYYQGGEALLCYMWKVMEIKWKKKKQSLIFLSLAVLWVIGNESEAVMHGRGMMIYKSTLLSTSVKEQRWHLLPRLSVVQKERNAALHYRQENTIPCVEGPYEGLEVNGDLNVFQILV